MRIADCKFCAWARNQYCSDCVAAESALSNASSDWEYAETGYFDLLDAESAANRSLLEEADDLQSASKEEAFAVRMQLALTGSPAAAFLVGWSYEVGSGVAVDQREAMQWLRKSIDGGSWTASLAYGRLLGKLGDLELCEQVLGDGIDAGLASAHYWLARLRYENSPKRKTAREVRWLLDHAIANGHPGAELFLARLMSKGKFGLRNIPDGIRLGMACHDRYRRKMEAGVQSLASDAIEA